jgi:hypothetical protein
MIDPHEAYIKFGRKILKLLEDEERICITKEISKGCKCRNCHDYVVRAFDEDGRELLRIEDQDVCSWGKSDET